MTNRSARLVQFTDPHLLADPAGSIRGARPLPRLQACIAHAQRHFFPVDAVALTGDIVHDQPAAYGAIDLLFADLDVPVLLIPGNHDLPDEMRRQLGHAPFQVGGEWLAPGGWQVLLLESWFAESADGEGQLGAAQLQALERALAAATAPHALVLLHHPPVSMDSPSMDELGLLDGPGAFRRWSPAIHASVASPGAMRTRRWTCIAMATCASCARPRPRCSSDHAMRTSRWTSGRPVTACSTCARTGRSRQKWSGSKATATPGTPDVA